LSAGERQLVALARAVVSEPEVLVLDEATATVDSHSDAVFQSALNDAAWAARSAVIMVAHRLSTALNAHRVIVMDAGRILEQGTPRELLDRGGRFASLVELDQSGWDWSGLEARWDSGADAFIDSPRETS
jgi:ATP-binding cassette subfamily B protein